MQFKDIVNSNRNDIAFIVGNGINRFPNNPKAISWEALLMQLWNKFAPNVYKEVPKGLSITEFYDLLDLACSNENAVAFQIQKEASRLLADWTFKDHHRAFIKSAHALNAPVLTTNFDLILPTCLGLKQYHTDTKSFTDFYPWTTYYGDKQLGSPTDGFGIWFINGFVKYHRSIRLGLSHYMGSVEKARNYLHKGDEKKLFSTKHQDEWRGSKTWLHIVFNKHLCVFGLALEENETFLRWLLIERAKYFKKFPGRAKKGWYVAPKMAKPDERVAGKIQFLKGIGLHLVETDDYKGIYQSPWI